MNMSTDGTTSVGDVLNGLKIQLKVYLDELMAYGVVSSNRSDLSKTTLKTYPLMRFWKHSEEFEVARDVMIASAGSISHEITKFALVFLKKPSVNECTSVTNVLLEPCEKLFLATNVAMFCGINSALAREVIGHSIRIFYSLRDLVQAFIDKDELLHNEDALAGYTGRIWEHTSTINRIPKSNFVASKRRLLEGVCVIKDTYEELLELLEQKASTDEEDVGETLLTEEEEDFGMNDEVLEGIERERTKIFVQVLDMLTGLYRRGIQTITELNDSENDEKILSWAATFHESYESVCKVVVDGAPCIYPPQEAAELLGKCDCLRETVMQSLAYLENYPRLEPDGKEADVLRMGRQRFELKLQELEESLRQVG